MKRYAGIILSLFLLMIFCFLTASSGPLSTSGGEEIETLVEALVKPYADGGGFSGALLAAKGGTIRLAKGYGMANVELRVPNTPKTKFHIASVSKTFTAAAVMRLREQGRLGLDDPVSKYVPDFRDGGMITLRHLLTNTSGIPNINAFPEYDSWSKFPHTPSDLVAKFKDKPLVFRPGERGYTESNSNYNLLAFIIEKCSGLEYGEFLRRHLFGPAGMNDSGHDGRSEALLENRADGYVPVGLADLEKAPFLDWSIKTGNGSIYSTVEDLHRWDRALAGGTILRKESLEMMFAEKFGWFSGTRFGRRVVRMNGRSPGFQSEIQRYPDEDACVIVLGNMYAPTASLIADGLAAILFGEKAAVPETFRPVSLDARILERYRGRYQFGPDFFVPGGIYDIAVGEGWLLMTARGWKATLIPTSESAFFDRGVWASIRFAGDQEGRVTHLVYRYGGTEYRAEKVK